MKKISKRKIRLSCGVVPVRKQDNKYQYLLLRLYANYEFPKGKIEENEKPLETAIRETKEETTIDDLYFKWGHDYIETEPYNKGKVARFYLAETEKETIELPVNPEIGRAEHHAYIWLNYDEARNKLNKRLKKVIDWANEKIY